MSIIDDIKGSAMSRFQILTIAVCLGVLIVDGFDVIAMSMSAHYVAQEWGISPSTLGYGLSASTAGMALGSLFLAPIGDRIGRRIIALSSLAVVAAGMLYSGLAGNFEHLMASRLITGIGIGGVMATVGVIISEYSSQRRIGLTMALFAASNGAGGVLGGLVAGDLIPTHGWRAVFLVGAAATAAISVVALFVVPESLDYLMTRRDPKSVQRLQHLASRMGRSVSDLDRIGVPVASPAGETSKSRYAELFTRGTIANTALLTIGYGALMATFYFIINWTPKLIAESTGDGQAGIHVGVLLPFGGIVGSIAFGLLTGVVKVRPLAAAALSLATIATVLMAYSLTTGAAPIVIALALGVLLNAGISGYYGIIPQAFPTRIRTTGFGFVLGVARILGIISPIAAGYLLGRFSPTAVFAGMGVIMGISAVVFIIHGRGTPQDRAHPTPLPQHRAHVATDELAGS